MTIFAGSGSELREGMAMTYIGGSGSEILGGDGDDIRVAGSKLLANVSPSSTAEPN